MEATPLTIFKCESIGISGARIFYQETSEGVEARQAVAMLGQFQMDEQDLEKIDYNPFHPAFNDNFAVGKGKSMEEALSALNADKSKMNDMLWM